MNDELLEILSKKLGNQMLKISALSLIVVIVICVAVSLRVSKWERMLNNDHNTSWRVYDMNEWVNQVAVSNRTLLLPDPKAIVKERVEFENQNEK